MQLVSTMGQYMIGGRYLAAGAVFDERNQAQAKYLVSLGRATPAPAASAAQATPVGPRAHQLTPRARAVQTIEADEAKAHRMAAGIVTAYRAHKGNR